MTRYNDFTKLAVTLERDETGMVVAECPAIPGCVSQGKTEEEALTNIQEAIQACLEVRREIAPGTLRKLIRLSGLSVDDFVRLR